MKYILTLTAFLISLNAFGHARFTSPTPRNNNAGIKTGPCGGLPRSANPTTVTGGQNLQVSWQETINHPGKYLISLSMGNDQNFNLLSTVIDNNATYTASVPIPDINCETCTLQLIQSMEENPSAPSYYFSCADIRIVASGGAAPTPTPSPGSPVVPQTNMPSAPNSTTKFGGGCGLIKAVHDSNSNPPPWTGLLILTLPLLILYRLRCKFSLSKI